jgi:hypothetical protein
VRELDPRTPHEVRYTRPMTPPLPGMTDKETVVGQVDHRGLVEMTEEALELILTTSGWTKENPE